MKIAIVSKPNDFSERWIEYCRLKGVDYKIVNPYDSDIISQLKDCDGFMWHIYHHDYRDALFAKQLILSLEQSGIKCFPNSSTVWHFDDKLGQKYLLEAVNCNLVPTYVFYTKTDALRWVDNSQFPIVFKLRSGAGASNVRLVKSKLQAKRIIFKSFGRGFSITNRFGALKDSFEKFSHGKSTLKDVLMKLYRLFKPGEFTKLFPREKGYVYFQDFVANNSFDIRVVAIGEKAFAIKRMVRKDDFRASGSGVISFEMNEIPEQCIILSFEVLHKIKAQCLAFDFVFDAEGKASIVEISFGFAMLAYDSCPGYWTEDLNWHNGPFNPQNWMIEDLISSVSGGI